MHKWLKFFLLFITSTSSVLPTLWGTFVFDDIEAVIKNKNVVEKESIFKIFTHDFWGVAITHPESHKSYRPLTTLTYRLDYIFWGLNATWYHFINILFHGINTCLVYIFLEKCLRIAKRNKPASPLVFWASMLFAVHPIHVEPLGGIVGRADLLSAFVFLCGFILTPETKWGGPIFSTLVAIFGSLFKETAIVLPILIVALDFSIRNKFRLGQGKLKEYLLPVFLIWSFVSWRVWFQNGIPTFQIFDNPPVFASNYFTKITSVVYVWGMNTFILLTPIWLCYDWSGNCIKLIESIQDLRFFLTLMFVAASCALIFKTIKNPVIVTACLLSFITFLPSSNLIITTGFVLAERNLYLPSIGFSLLMTYAILKKGHFTVFLFVLVVFYARSVQRSYEWVEQSSLFKSGLEVCPNNAKIHYNIGTMYAGDGNSNASEVSYKTAISLRPDYYQAMNNLGNLLREKNLAEAEYWLRKAVRVKTDFPAAWMNLGIVLSKTNLSEALSCYKNALKYRPSYPDCYYNLGNLYLSMGDKDAALNAWMRATSLKPHAQSWINSVILLEQEENFKTAKEVALSALLVIPDSDTLHFILGNILGKLNEYEVAESSFLNAISLCKKDGRNIPPKYFTNLGVLYHHWNRRELAIEAYMNSFRIKPSESVKRNLQSLKVKV